MKLIFKSIYLQYRNSKLFTITIFLISLISIVLIYAEVNVLSKIIDNIQHSNNEIAIAYVIYFTMIVLFNLMKKPLMTFLFEKIKIRNSNFLDKIANKLTAISCSSLDEENTNKLIERVKEEHVEKITAVFENAIVFLTEVLSIISVVLIARKAGTLFFILLIILIFSMLLIIKKINKLSVDNYFTRSEMARKETYINGLFFNREIAQERRNYDFYGFLEGKLTTVIEESNRNMSGNVKKMYQISWLYDVITYSFIVLAYLMLLFPLASNKIELSFLIALIPAIKRIATFFVTIINVRLPKLQENIEFLKSVKLFYSLPEQSFFNDDDIDVNIIDCIEFVDVYFAYPTGENVINKLSFKLYNNKSYALVGKNGCGKSTLIKLIIGLYEPTKGQILYNNKKSNEVSFAEKMKIFGVVFQDFSKFEFSIIENICLSNDKINNNLINAVEIANFSKEIENQSDGYDTVLGKLYTDGVDLSTGQWQKLSIARMLYRKNQIKIFDEPTASLDPIAESTLYHNYNSRIRGDGMSIFVTHRLGATTMVDEVLVMEKGQIVQIGNHNKLISDVGSIYESMYSSQRGLYI